MKMGALQLVKIGFLVGVVFLTAPSPDKAVEGSIEVMIDLHVPVDLTESQPVDLTN